MLGTSIPSRVFEPQRARARYGDLLERMVAYLDRGDELADAAVTALDAFPVEARDGLIERALDGERRGIPDELRAVVAVANQPAPWVDWSRIERGAKTFRRAGPIGGLTLGMRSLVYGYAAPAGNKPLALSGRLEQMAQRRIAETGRFVSAVSAPGGMRPGAPGTRITVRVRLMHARVRALALRSGRWDSGAWSLPINQHDMLATILLFSSVWIDGVRIFGLRVSEDEADDHVHLWRHVGRVIGVDADLLPSNYVEAAHLARFIRDTQHPPDDDSRALVDALIRQQQPPPGAESGRALKLFERRLDLAEGLCRALVDDEALADGLGLARSPYRYAVPVLRPAVNRIDGLRERFAFLGNALADRLGTEYWSTVTRIGLGDRPARFEFPTRLLGRRSSD